MILSDLNKSHKLFSVTFKLLFNRLFLFREFALLPQKFSRLHETHSLKNLSYKFFLNPLKATPYRHSQHHAFYKFPQLLSPSLSKLLFQFQCKTTFQICVTTGVINNFSHSKENYLFLQKNPPQPKLQEDSF